MTADLGQRDPEGSKEAQATVKWSRLGIGAPRLGHTG